MTIRLVCAEDAYLIREGIRLLLETQPDVELVASVGDADALLDAVASRSPDVVLTDIRMPPSHTDEGIRAAEQLASSNPDLGVVVLSQYVEPEYALRLLESGAGGRVSREAGRTGEPPRRVFGAAALPPIAGRVSEA